MTDRSVIHSNIEQIVEYQNQHPELLQAHHFLYDKRYSNAEKCRYVLMGINPGEGPSDWAEWPVHGAPAEETSRFDFQTQRAENRSARRWRKTCEAMLNTLDISLTEMFFWSSKNVAELADRYGSLKSSKHVEFCKNLNTKLIEYHDPEAVIVVGIGHLYRTLIPTAYQLQHIKTVPNASGHQLVAQFTDGRRPWIFCKHWTGARISAEETTTMQNAIREASAWRSADQMSVSA